jgi:uncharacterized protein YjiS (DUF1127 family)
MAIALHRAARPRGMAAITALGRVFDRLTRLARAVTLARREQAYLLRLGDRDLRDLAITRADLQREARRPLRDRVRVLMADGKPPTMTAP